MKEKAADVEDHRTKVELEQQQHPISKTTTSSTPTGKTFVSPANPTGSAPNPAISQQQKQTTGVSSKTALLSPSSNNNNSSNANNNFDDDYNEWDISIGDLIIDLDADIERQSEGDKPTRSSVESSSSSSNNNNQENKSKDNNIINSRKKIDSPPNQAKRPETSALPAGMSSNFKLSRLGTLASSGGSSGAAASSASTTTPTITGSANGGNGSGSGSGHLNRHSSHANNPNPKNNYAVSSLNVASSVSSNSSSSSPSSSSSSSSSTTPSSSTTTKSLNSSSIEHHAKSLKMKIKRKSIGGKISEVNHEIVSSDASPQACNKTYISSLDHHNSNSSSSTTAPNAAPASTPTAANQSNANNVVANSSSSTIQHIPNLNSTSIDNSQNSVINATDPEEIAISANDSAAAALSKSVKHSAKNKNGHREKKDKNRMEKEKINFPPNAVNSAAAAPTVAIGSTANESDELVSSTLNAIPASVTLKYPNSTVINQMKPEELKKPRLEKVDDHIADRTEMGTMTSIATITEPDCLGPCEPGTSVTLEGIVWQETENGVLVVNVTWRGKTYVGTLLDCTKHDWAPPRFCESPTSDIESKSLKNTRGKRSRNSFIAENSIDTRSVTSKLRNGKGRRTANSGYVPTSPAGKNDPMANVNKRKGRPNDLELSFSEEAGKRTKMSKLDGCDVQPNSPVLIECPEPNCSKKYRHINGLKYHQSHAHFGSSFNVSDTQEFEPASETLTSNKGDASDSEYNDSLNVLDSPLKTIDKSLADAIVKKQDMSGLNEQPDPVSSNTNSLSVESKKLVKSSANEPPVAAEGHKNQPENGGKPSLLSRTKSDTTHEDKPEPKESIISDKVDKSDVLDTEVNTTNMTDHSRSQSGPTKSSNEIENVPSPAYSDISDDNSSNDNSTTVPPSQSLDKANDSFMETKKMANNFNLSTLPHYFNKSQYLMPPNQPVDSKPKDLKLPDSTEMTIDNIPEQASRAQGLYAPYPSLYRFGSSPSSKNAPPVNTKEPSPPIGKNEIETMSKDSGNVKDNNEFNINSNNPNNHNPNKQPIVELQNLKNRIQYTFDQNPVYDMPKPKYPTEGDKSKDRSKYSPQLKKPKEKDDKDKGKHDEGMKPTMETTGPPTLTNGYYYNPSFLPTSFPPFDAMFRGNPMNPAVMGPPYGPPGPSSFLHPHMRFPHLGPLDGLPPMPGSNVARTSATPTSHSSSASSVKISHSYNHNPNKMLSPTTSSPCVPSSSHSALSLSASSSTVSSHKPSPNKEFPNPAPNSLGGVHSDQSQRPATSSNSSMHSNARHPPLHTSHIGYPIFDPYSAMIVNHSVQANAAVHQFTPK